MAFDGITIRSLIFELNNKILNGRIDKIAQPEKDELLLTIKTPSGQQRLMLSVNASLPLAYLVSSNKPSPLTAPNFCMLLRKHINNGRITEISQPGLERIIDFKIEHLNELGDMCTKHLMVELMGKHSNIIFIDDNNKIIDSIKRINASVSSVREVLPGFDYFIPNTTDKADVLAMSEPEITEAIKDKALPVSKILYQSFTGISPQVNNEICDISGVEARKSVTGLSNNELTHFVRTFYNILDTVKNNDFNPVIITTGKDKIYDVINYGTSACDTVKYDSVSRMLEDYYKDKNISDRIRQRSADLRQIVSTALVRNYKKYDLQQKQLDDTSKRETYRIYGELLNVYGYEIPKDAKSCEVLNYYTNENITIPLDPQLSALENSKKYFAKYNKLKRTYEALSELVLSTKAEIDHLESINTALDIAVSYEDLGQIREELIEYGFIKKNLSKKGKEKKVKCVPFHYISSHGFDIYVGKNNIQNEELTFKFATGNDWWFHAKNMPGSHVIVKCDKKELPDKTYEEAAALAAYYSKGRTYEKVEVDYVERKQLKKVTGGAPGFVIYHTNYSMNISPDISKIKEVK